LSRSRARLDLCGIACGVFAIACTPVPATLALPTSEVESSGIASKEPQITRRPLAQELLGLLFSDPLVRSFVSNAKLEIADYGNIVFWRAHEDGFELLVERGVITAVFMREGQNWIHRDYEGAMPGGIDFGDSVPSVRARLGPPDVQGSDENGSDVWHHDGWTLHVEYGRGSVELVMVTTAPAE
jgi:hypothetical protein